MPLIEPSAHRLPPPRLVLVCERSLFVREEDWLERVEELARLTRDDPRIALQLRAAQQDEERRRALIEAAVREVGRDTARWLVNLEQAPGEELAAYEWHLPERTLPHLSTTEPQRAPDSVAVHSLASAVEAAARRARWVQCGPVHDPGSKPGRGMGLRAFAAFVARCPLPVIAVGGITSARVGALLEAGVHGVAVATAVVTAPNREAALRAFELPPLDLLR